MLQAISWQQYLTAVSFTTLVWYGFVGLRYYRAEIIDLLTGRPSTKKSSITPVTGRSVMGDISPDEQERYGPEKELLIAPGNTPDDLSEQTLPRGPGDELQEEAFALANAFRENDDKPAFISMLHALVNRYELDREEISLPAFLRALRGFAEPVLPFSLSEQEWAISWPEH